MAEMLVDESLDVMTVAQLDVTLAEAVAGASRVVFVDSERRISPPVTVQPVEASSVDPGSAHGLEPGAMITLVAALYGEKPECWLVSVAAPHMGHGEGLSAIAAEAAAEAADHVAAICGGEVPPDLS